MNIEEEKNNMYNQIINHSLIKENNQNLNINSITKENQNQFLETTLGKTINNALDIGLRLILPDIIENQIIEIKDTLLESGLKDGVQKAIDISIEFGKSALGIVTGKFDNISQIQTAVEKGGIIDNVSDSLDVVLNYTNKKGILPKNIITMIKSGKNILLDNIQNNLQKTMTNQIKGIEKIDQYIQTWNKALKEENFSKMEQSYVKLKKELENLIPLENTLKKARELENLHLLIKNKGNDLSLSEEEIGLAKKLV